MKRLLVLAFAASVFQFAFAQDADEEGCKNHPLFTRLANFHISACIDNFNAIPVHFSAEKTEDKEGHVVKISYSFSPPNDQTKPPSLTK